MKNLWNQLGMAQANITKLENKVLAELQPPRMQERVLPFLEEAEFEFAFGEHLTEQQIVLVQNANRQTRITELNYSVSFRIPPLVVGNPDTLVVARSTAFGASGVLKAGAFPTGNLFDFDWNLEMGRTNTSYANGRVEGQPRALSRQSLGFVNNNVGKAFSEKNPLIMGTNEFFKIKVKPTLFASSGGFNTPTAVIVKFQATGWRTLSSN